MTIATKNNAIILKDGKAAEGCGCCGGWYCVACESITSSGYTTTTFGDECWFVWGTRNPLSFAAGYASRCMTLEPEGDIAITISATLASRPNNGATVGVAIGGGFQSFAPFGSGDFSAFAGYAIGFGQGGQDRIQSGWPGNTLASANASFSGTISAVFSRRGGIWYVATDGLPEVTISRTMPAQGYLFHGVTGTNEIKVFSSYSVTVT